MNEKQLTMYRREHLGYVFQMYNLIPNLTVRENIEVGAYLGPKPLDVDELLHLLGLYDHRKKLPNQLSGGQQQRTAYQEGFQKYNIEDGNFRTAEEITALQRKKIQEENITLYDNLLC